MLSGTASWILPSMMRQRASWTGISKSERIPIQTLPHEIRVETEYERLVRAGPGANRQRAQQITPVEHPFTAIPGQRDAGIDEVFAALDGGGRHGVRDLGGCLVDHQRDLVFAGEKSLRDRRDRRVDVHPRRRDGRNHRQPAVFVDRDARVDRVTVDLGCESRDERMQWPAVDAQIRRRGVDAEQRPQIVGWNVPDGVVEREDQRGIDRGVRFREIRRQRRGGHVRRIILGHHRDGIVGEGDDPVGKQ